MRDLIVFPFNASLPAHFDHQASGTFGECERMAYYQQVLARQGRGLSIALDWGRTYHACVDIILTKGDVGMVQEFISTYMQDDQDDHYGRTPQRMIEALVKWYQWYTANPIKILRTEQPTIVKCDSPCVYYDSPGGCNLEYGGIMDAVVEWQGYLGPLDRKTTVKKDSDPVSQYMLSHQMMGYDWICSHLIGKHCWGAIVERCLTNKSNIFFDRFPIPVSRDRIREWVENEKVLQSDFRYKFENYPDQEVYWRQNRARCWEPYACQYRDVCLTSPGKFRTRWLLDNTVERRWDFTRRDETDEVAQLAPVVKGLLAEPAIAVEQPRTTGHD